MCRCFINVLSHFQDSIIVSAGFQLLPLSESGKYNAKNMSYTSLCNVVIGDDCGAVAGNVGSNCA